MRIPEPALIDPLSHGGPELFGTLHKTPGIYAFAVSGRITHLGWSANLGRRLRRLLCTSDGAGSALAQRLAGGAGSVQYWPTGSRLQSSLLLYRLAKAHFPDDYGKRLRLRMPWFVALTDKNRFPRLVVVNRLGEEGDSAFGPFRSREGAQRYGEEVMGAFSLRRCSEELNPAPGHPGCIYGEMNLCLRPCQMAVDNDQYRREAESVENFLGSNGKNMVASLSLAREKAASDWDFETAAQIHKRIEKLKSAAASRDEIVTEVGSFNGVAVTRGRAAGQVQLWPMLAGCWQEPILLEPGSMDDLDPLLAPVFHTHACEGQRAEHLAVFTRWYYSSFRDGDWIALSKPDGVWRRKLVRSVSKLAKSTGAEAVIG